MDAHTMAVRQMLARQAALSEAQVAAETVGLVEALEWYGEQACLCRKITGEGDIGRLALDRDGGKRARTALAPFEATP